MSRSSQQATEPAYYIADCRIFDQEDKKEEKACRCFIAPNNLQFSVKGRKYVHTGLIDALTNGNGIRHLLTSHMT